MRRFRIGARVRWFQATYPFGSLSATPERIVVRAGFGQQVLDRGRVEAVYRARWFVRKAILFQTADRSGNWVLVYSPTPQRLLDALKTLGWPVDE